AADRAKGAGDLAGGPIALHPRRTDDEMRVRMTPAKDVDDVANRCAVERRDDANLAGQRGQRPFPRGVEEPLAVQPLLQLIEGELQRAEAMRLQVLADQLVLALGLIDRHASTRDHALAVGWLELQIVQRG